MAGRLTFGTGPIALDERGEECRRLLGDLLSLSLRVQVDIQPAYTYSELLAQVGRREVQLAWLGPALYVQAAARFSVVALARVERDGHSRFRGSLFVRDDSPHRDVASLAGARVAWVDPDSCAGYLFPRVELARRGHDPDRFFADARMLGSHAAVVDAVARGECDVGASFIEVSDPEQPDATTIRSGWSRADVAMRPLLVSESVPGDVIVATRALAEASWPIVIKSLLLLHEASGGADVVRDLFQASRFVGVDEAGYDVVRDALRASGVRF